MYEISELSSQGYDWTIGKILGVDTTDPVLGGVDGVANKSATDLAIRTRNLHDRLVQIEAIWLEDPDAIINNLKDIIDAFQGIPEGPGKLFELLGNKLNKDGSGLNASQIQTLLTNLSVYNKTEVNNLLSAQNTALQNNINQEANARAAADTANYNNLMGHIQWRTQPDGGNINRLSFLNALGFRRGHFYIGDILGTDNTYIVTINGALPSNDYLVAGGFLSTAPLNQWNAHNDNMWTVVDRQPGQFTLAVSNPTNQTQTALWFSYLILYLP